MRYNICKWKGWVITMDKQLMQERKKILMDIIKSPNYIPMKSKELAMILNVPKTEKQDLEEVLSELVAEGRVALSKKGKYCKPNPNIKIGIFEGTARGFGFVVMEDEEEDIYIPEGYVGGAMNGDRVQAVIRNTRSGRRREGEIIEVLQHNTSELVGIFQKSKNFGFVVPDNPKFSKDIFVPIEKSKGAVDGHKVVVGITDYGSDGKKPEGFIKEIIGHVDDPGTDIVSIVKSMNIPMDFPDDVKRQLESIPDEVSSKEFAGRLDLRDWQTVTIDGEDAKDLDDAITLTKEKDKYVLGVHIADVTNYVKEGSPLDVEAVKRGTSVYLVDRVIPMLPHKLSNGICSLNQGVDRLALSCIMDIDFKGKIIGHKIAETVIRVDRRMSYTSVRKILVDNDEQEIKEYNELVPMFKLMAELSEILRNKRMKRGAIDFDFPESKIILDEKGKPMDIKPYERNVATKIIEDFMLAANETIAEDYFWQEIPFVFRTHDNPDSEKMIKLGTFISNFGYGIKTTQEEIHPKELQKLLLKIEGTPEEALISRLTLRSMKQAKYTTVCSGHFGLATQYYCHFTSPIRRYPDLQIHRIIKENIHGGIKDKRMKHYKAILPGIAEQCSINERRADEAERDTDKLKMTEYMSQHIGEEYEGVISGMTTWGMYVELPNTVEGMVRIGTITDDLYYYDDEKYQLIGQTDGRVFKLGQKVKIKVVKTDKVLRQIDFELAEEE